MRVEFSLPAIPAEGQVASPDPPSPVGSATWNDGIVEIESDDPDVRADLTKAFRRTPVVTSDGSYRRLGTHGEVQIPPGDLEWFRVVALVRVPAELGLHARLIPGVTEGGYDPASGYRTFEESIERLGAQSGGGAASQA